MHTSPNNLWRAIAVALLALAPATGLAAEVERAGIIAQADEDDDEPPPPQRGKVPEEAETPDEEPPPARLGNSVRPDPFDVIEEPRRPAPAAAVMPNNDPVICEAGCNGPRGIVVYQKKK